MSMSFPQWLARAALAALLLASTGVQAQAGADCPPGPPDPGTFMSADARRQARDRGLLWQLEKDGRRSYLYATVHLSRADWAIPGPRIVAALRSMDVVALELDPGDPELMTALLRPGDTARSERILAGLRERLDRLAARGCVPQPMWQAIRTTQPLIQLTVLMAQEGRRAGFHPELAVDAVLGGVANIAGKPVVALETPAQQLEALKMESEADERQLIERSVSDLESGKGRDGMLKLLQLWADGDEAALANYPQWCECMDTPAERRFSIRLNDERNPGMADKLAALHAKGTRFFAAVGALHMTGPQTLTTLLQARGFKVERVLLD